MAYSPSNPPGSYNAQYLFNELQKISSELKTPTVDSVRLNKLNVAPIRPQEDTVYNADGVSWNPGTGAGLYVYLSGAYVKL